MQRIGLSVSPNPFRSSVNIRYMIGGVNQHISGLAGGVSGYHRPELKIYDATGRVVKSFNPGSSIEHQGSVVLWYGDDNTGRRLPGGVYFIEFTAGDYSVTEKLLLIR